MTEMVLPYTVGNDLRVAVVQPDSVWQAPQVNRERIVAMTDSLAPCDLIVLPEMFTAGFSMNVSEVAEAPVGPTLEWMQALARQHDAAVCGSYAVMKSSAEKPVNRLVWMQPDGQYQYYDKKHLFRMGGEHERYQAGDQRLIVQWRGWRICPLICYDLRFPVWCRNRNDYDLAIYVANWPAARSYHWRQLLIARAIENQACTIGVNRVGVDGRGLTYSGDSLVIDAQGKLLLDPMDQAGCFSTVLGAEEINHYRQRFPAFLDADPFTV